MRVAILGARGIPACYSGYDTLVEELSVGLIESNSTEVIVYCRKNYYTKHPDTYRNVQLVYFSAPRIKAFESLYHSFISALHVLGQRADVIYFVDPANAPFCLLLRLFLKNVVIHTNGLGWKRTKWGPFARRYYKFVEWLSAKTANALVTDNPGMEAYYKKEYGTASTYIPYGAESHYGSDETIYEELELLPNGYLLVVARLEPENNTDFVIAEYVRSEINIPLIIVGDSPYKPSYMDRLKRLTDKRVSLVGRINDQAKLNALYKGAYLYIHAHEVGGTNPSLLRAMHAGAAPLVLNVDFNRSVVADSGFVFEKKRGALTEQLERLYLNSTKVRETGEQAKTRVDTYFRWDSVVADHFKLFSKVI